MKILGIDEAGRGPVVGSMFIGGFMIEKENLEDLEEIGVKDSKKLSDKKREDLLKKIEKEGKVFVKEIEAQEIDSLREVMSLNEIELQGFASVIEKAKADKVVMDLPEPNGERFIKKIKKEIPRSLREAEFIAEHGADDKYPIVSAASIVAKSAREKHIDELKEKYDVNFGSGYPHDEPTREFLRKYYQEKEEFPKETRMSWSSVQKIKEKASQSSIEEF